MQRRRRYRYKRGNRGMLVLMLVLTAAFLVSCVAGSNVLWVKGLFDFDVTDYNAEPVQMVHPVDGEQSRQLCELVEILTVQGLVLTPFEGASQAVSYYRDAILNDMLRDSYFLYNGNSELLELAAKKYPRISVSTLIPAADFENAVSRFFGGAGARHRDGDLFQYLSRVDAYTAPVSFVQSWVEIEVCSVEETLHTYRMVFRLSDGEVQSEEYTAIFVKRDDGTVYLNALKV